MTVATLLMYAAYLTLAVGMGVLWFSGAISGSVWPRSVNDPDPAMIAVYGWSGIAFGAVSVALGTAHVIVLVAS
jgi:hypothetical protein